jgi:hypothetical protein
VGEYADEYIDSLVGDDWGGIGDVGFRRRYFRHRPLTHPQRDNVTVFSAYGTAPPPEHGLFKPGVRVVHKNSGSAGVVLSTRPGQICWRPDSRLKPGGIWVDESKFRFEL